MSTIKIKRLYNMPSSSWSMHNLAPGELGYTGWDNCLYIGNAEGNGNILINDFSEMSSELSSIRNEALSEAKVTVENDVLQLALYNINGREVYKLALDHVHSNYVNQNAFGEIHVNDTVITADEVVDALSLIAGDNIVLTAEATDNKITIKATDTTYTLSNTTGTNPTVKLTDNNENPQNIQIVGSGATTVTGANGKITISSTDNNTKNTAGSTNTSSKIFLVGATSQAANPQTYSHDTAYVGTDGCLYSNKTKVSVEGHNHDSRYCAYKTFTFNDGTSTFASAPSGGVSCSASTYNDTLNFVSADGLMSFDAYSDTSGEETVDIYLNVDPAGTAISQAQRAESAAKSYADSKDATMLASAQSYANTAVSNFKSTLAAGSGLSLNGTTFSHSNSIAAGTASGSSGTLSHGDSFTVPKITYNATGHITGTSATTLTLPAAPTIPTLSKGTDKKGTAVTVAPNTNKKATFTAITDTSVSGHTVTDTNTTFTLDLSSFATTSEISTAMVFKGTLGTNGTITSLPSATTNTIGDTYKVITAGTYASIVAKVGDVFVCSSTPAWVLIPSGDEPSGTVTNIATGTGLTGGPITSTGTISVKMSSTALGATGALGTTTTTSKVYGVQPDKDGNLAVYVPWSNTTYSAATTSAAGLMSATDKAKLDGIATSANKYSLPTASSSTLGGVKIGSNINISSGVISVPAASGTTAGVTIVYPAASCTTFTSDTGTCTPLAVKKAVGMFEPKAHTHNYAGSSSAGGAATSANKVNTNLTIKLNSGSTEGTNMFTFNGSAAKTVNITPSAIGAADSSHTHSAYVDLTSEQKIDGEKTFANGLYVGGTNNSWGSGASGSASITYDDDTLLLRCYEGGLIVADDTAYFYKDEVKKEIAPLNHTHNYAGSSSAGGAATSANKVNANLAIKLNGGTTEGTNLFTFNGSAAKTVNITPSAIGAATSGHNHNGVYVKGDYEVKTMSLSAYNALTSKDSKTIYLITS